MRIVAWQLVGRWRIVAMFIVLVTILSVLGMTKLSFDVSPDAIFTSDNRVFQDLEQFYLDFGHDDNDLIVILQSEDLFTPSRLQQIRQLRHQLASINDVGRVASVFDLRRRGSVFAPLIPPYLVPTADFQALRESVIRHPIAANQFISNDGGMMIMWIHVKGDSLPLSKVIRVVDPVRDCIARFEHSSGIKALLAGHLTIRAETLGALQQSMIRGSLLSIFVAGVVAFLLFRGVVPVIVCCVGPIIGVIWTLGVMGWTGQMIGGLGTVLPTLVMVIGLANSVHLLLESNRQLYCGRSSKRATFRAIVRVGPACLLTSLTTVIGFGSLVLSETYSVKQFGLCAASGSAIALLAVLLALPVLNQLVDPATLLRHHLATDQRFFKGMYRAARFPIRYSRSITISSIVVCLMLAWPALQQRPDIIWTETLARDSDATIALEQADQEMGGALRAYVVVQWPPEMTFPDSEIVAVSKEIHQAIAQTEGLRGEFSLLNILACLPGNDLESRYRLFKRQPNLHQDRLINESRRRLVVSALVPNDGAAALADRIVCLESSLQQIALQHPGYTFHVSGTVVVAARNMRALIGDLGTSLAAAGIVIFFVLTLAFRSLRMGWISVIPNAFPLLVTAAGLVLLGYPLQITSALTFSLCLGLAVDDTIHVITRFKQFQKQPGIDHEQAVRETVAHVGPALAITTGILGSGFAAMLVSPMPGIQMFSLLSCVIMVTACLGDLIILPAFLALFGQR